MIQKFTPIISENFNGGEVFGINPTKIANNEFQKALNIRMRLEGGFFPRPGYYQKDFAGMTGLGTEGYQGLYSTIDEMFLAINGKLFASLPDATNAYPLITTLDADADVGFLTFQGDIYSMNGVDYPQRVARTTTATALVATVSNSLTLQAGQGWRFAAAGTFVVTSANGVDNIAYTRVNDVMTINPATVLHNHPAGSQIFEILPIATAPRMRIGAEFQNTWFAAGILGESGQLYTGNTLYYSRGATGVNPEYFYDFAGAGSGYIPVGDKSDIVALFTTKTYLLIFKTDAIFYCTGFDSSNVPIIQPLSKTYGAAGARAVAQVGDQVVTFTGKAIKTVGEVEGLPSEVPSVNANFDFRIFKKLVELDADQHDACMCYNPDQKLLKIWVNENGTKTCFVLDTNIAVPAWSRDTNKSASCATVFKSETFWGAATEPLIMQDEVGSDDNGLAIRSEVRLKEFNAGTPRNSKCFQYHFLYGLLGQGTTVTVNIYFDDDLIQTYVLDDSLIQTTNGSPIGRGLIGEGISAGAAIGVLGYLFEQETLLKKRRNIGRMSVEFISDGVGQVFEIQGQEINGFYTAKFDRTIRA